VIIILVNYYFNLEYLWENPSTVPFTYVADGPYMLGDPVIDNFMDLNGAGWDTTSRYVNMDNWMDYETLLGNTAGSIYSGNNDTWAGWVYLYSMTSSGTVITTTA